MCHFDNFSSTLATVPGAYEWAVPVIYCVIEATPELGALTRGLENYGLWEDLDWQLFV